MTSTLSANSHTDRAMQLLGAGVSTEAVAAALGVTPSAISQMLANETFADQVAQLRYNQLQQHNERDAKYDSVEDRLLAKLEGAIPLMMKPGDILGAIRIINGAKRRGQVAPEQVSNTAQIVSLVLPTAVINKVVNVETNIHNQVVSVGEQSLQTIQSSTLIKQVEAKQEAYSQLSDAEKATQLTLESLGETNDQYEAAK